MKIGVVVLVLLFSQSHAVAQGVEKSLVEVCKSDCPKAKNDEEAHKCVEKKGRLNKEFRKSKCWEVNEEYEKRSGGAQEAK